MVAEEKAVEALGLDGLDATTMRHAKQMGLGDAQLADIVGTDEKTLRDHRRGLGVVPSFKSVDSCAAEVEARSTYRYSCYDAMDEKVEDDRPSVVILGSGPNRIGYPVLVRPSYVLGGRAMRICYDEATLRDGHVGASTLVDRFVEDAIEIDVDAVSDGRDVLIGAVMQHVEEAGIHSGDSACVIPPLSIGAAVETEVRRQTIELARALGVVGLVNVQYAIRDGEVYVLEANPRASRTVPFVAKATGIPLVDAAVRVALGERVEDLNIDEATPGMVSVKEAVLPFARFPGADALLGPEMRATGEVMGTGPDFATAFAKAQRAAGQALPSAHPAGTSGVALTVNDRDKPAAASIAQQLVSAGFTVYSTEGTARAMQQMGIKVHQVAKLSEPGDTIPDLIRDGKIALVINTPLGMGARGDGYEIRRAAVQYRVPCITTMSGAAAAVQAMSMAWKVDAKALQDLHRAIGGAA